MRNRFDNELEKLDKQLIEMGMLIEEAIKVTSTALIDKDVSLTTKAIEFEKQIDLKEREIETLCLKLICEQQPVAKDLRVISSALKMITDMERIGDHARDISEIIILMHSSGVLNVDNKVISDIKQMSLETIKMVKESIDAFVSKDIDVAKSVIAYDDVVDDLFYVIKNDLIDFIVHDKEHATTALDLLMIAKYFERIGDHAVNIAEWVVYKINGEHKTL